MASDPGVTGPGGTLDDPLAESLRLVEIADARGLTLRLMGGMAVRAHAPRWPARTRRTEVDLDFDEGGVHSLERARLNGGEHRRFDAAEGETLLKSKRRGCASDFSG